MLGPSAPWPSLGGSRWIRREGAGRCDMTIMRCVAAVGHLEGSLTEIRTMAASCSHKVHNGCTVDGDEQRRR